MDEVCNSHLRVGRCRDDVLSPSVFPARADETLFSFVCYICLSGRAIIKNLGSAFFLLTRLIVLGLGGLGPLGFGWGLRLSWGELLAGGSVTFRVFSVLSIPSWPVRTHMVSWSPHKPSNDAV